MKFWRENFGASLLNCFRTVPHSTRVECSRRSAWTTSNRWLYCPTPPRRSSDRARARRALTIAVERSVPSSRLFPRTRKMPTRTAERRIDGRSIRARHGIVVNRVDHRWRTSRRSFSRRCAPATNTRRAARRAQFETARWEHSEENRRDLSRRIGRRLTCGCYKYPHERRANSRREHTRCTRGNRPRKRSVQVLPV